MELTLCGKSDFPYLKELLLKERIRSLWEQILSFKRSSDFEKGSNCKESLLDTVVSLYFAYFFSVLATPLWEFVFLLSCGCSCSVSLPHCVEGLLWHFLVIPTYFLWLSVLHLLPGSMVCNMSKAYLLVFTATEECFNCSKQSRV